MGCLRRPARCQQDAARLLRTEQCFLPGTGKPSWHWQTLHAACDENGAVAALGANERTDRLLNAEAAVLEAGGCVVRLVGLYHAQRCGRRGCQAQHAGERGRP